MRIVPRGRGGMCFAEEEGAKAITGLLSWIMCVNSEGVDKGLAGEIMTLRERREKYNIGTWKEGGEIMRATFLLLLMEREGNWD